MAERKEGRAEALAEALSPTVSPLDDGIEGIEVEPASPTTQRNTCVICFDENNSHTVVPCGHRCVCAACAPKLQGGRCPICREQIVIIIDGMVE